MKVLTNAFEFLGQIQERLDILVWATMIVSLIFDQNKEGKVNLQLIGTRLDGLGTQSVAQELNMRLLVVRNL